MEFRMMVLSGYESGSAGASIIYRFFSDSLKLQLIDARSGKMDMHWIASAAVLLVMAVLSAYREALKNEPIRPGLERGGVPYIEEFDS
ncbi:hypothetical protein [Burkholderia pyrrocinia]|uniref:hypothetical protein n=1 Tax=Burkholderia pyrrocinia TaxID=60550 RepID=UPI002AB11C60|nr:hypothetical protein [Burkholderia pyrrocinia]